MAKYSIDARGYTNQPSNVSHGLFGNNNSVSENITRSLPKKVPSEKIARQRSRWQEVFNHQSRESSLSRENEVQEPMPSTPVRYRAAERMMSPAAISPHRQRTASRLEEAANEQRVFGMQVLGTRIEEGHRRNAFSMPIIEEGAGGDPTDELHDMYKTALSLRSSNVVTQDRRSFFPTQDYVMSSNYRPRPEDQIGDNPFNNQYPSQGMAHSAVMNNSIFHGHINDTVPAAIQPAPFTMALVFQDPQQSPATYNPNGLAAMAMMQGTNPWAGMIMSSPTLKPSNMLLRQQGKLPPMIEEAPKSLSKGEHLSETYEEEKVLDEENCALVCNLSL